MTKESNRDLLERIKNVGHEVALPDGRGLPSPPKGMPILELPPSAKLYKVGIPTKQTDLLIGYERRYIIPIALLVAPLFRTEAKPDDVYRALPEHAKSNLHVIYSRSGIERHGDKLNWDAVVVTVQKLCIVRINCDLYPTQDKFEIRGMLLWSRKTQDYQPVVDPQGQPIEPSVLPYILDRYVEIEKIFEPRTL